MTEKEDDLEDPKAKEMLADARAAMKRLSDYVAKVRPKGFKPEGIIDNYTEYVLAKIYLRLEEEEKYSFSQLEKVLDAFPIYTEYLKSVTGCGPAMSAIIITEVDITKCKYPSSLWKYAGLDVAPDGKGRSRKSEHLVDREYKSKTGEMKTKKALTYNPWLKSKLTAVLGASFLRMGPERSKYARIYYDYKHRLTCRPDLSDVAKMDIHRKAIRYMIKMFLLDLHVFWRGLEGLEVSKSYHEAKLNHVHSSPTKQIGLL